MKRLLQSSWLVSLTGCVIYLATTAAVLSMAKFEGVMPTEEVKYEPGEDPSWKFRNPEFEQWVEDVRREKAALDLRKAQLDELETRLKAERQELTTVTQRVAQLQADFEKNIVRLKDEETKTLKRQAKAMADMAPEAAAAMLAQMADDDAVRLLSVMKNDQVTQLLETLSKSGRAQASRAAALTERMRHLLPDAGSGSSTQ